MERKKISTRTHWEPIIGYSRAVRTGHYIHVSGTTSTDETGTIVALGDAHAQTVQIIKNIETALKRLGANLANVVRTRIYLVSINDWEGVGHAHSEFFREIMPACTMVEVRRLIDPKILVEIEADAIIEEHPGQ